tara:strand:+ start:370 stop:1983 length:1614 start_codon:yes stop_codon:yes gene_type:complete
MNEKNGIYTTTKLIKRVRNSVEWDGDKYEEGYTQYSTGLSYNCIGRVRTIFNTEDSEDRQKKMSSSIREKDEKYTYYKYVNKEWVETDRWDALVYAYDLNKNDYSSTNRQSVRKKSNGAGDLYYKMKRMNAWNDYGGWITAKKFESDFGGYGNAWGMRMFDNLYYAFKRGGLMITHNNQNDAHTESNRWVARLNPSTSSDQAYNMRGNAIIANEAFYESMRPLYNAWKANQDEEEIWNEGYNKTKALFRAKSNVETAKENIESNLKDMKTKSSYLTDKVIRSFYLTKLLTKPPQKEVFKQFLCTKKDGEYFNIEGMSISDVLYTPYEDYLKAYGEDTGKDSSIRSPTDYHNMVRRKIEYMLNLSKKRYNHDWIPEAFGHNLNWSLDRALTRFEMKDIIAVKEWLEDIENIRVAVKNEKAFELARDYYNDYEDDPAHPNNRDYWGMAYYIKNGCNRSTHDEDAIMWNDEKLEAEYVKIQAEALANIPTLEDLTRWVVETEQAVSVLKGTMIITNAKWNITMGQVLSSVATAFVSDEEE